MKKVIIAVSIAVVSLGTYACKSSKNASNEGKKEQMGARQNRGEMNVEDVFKQLDANKDGKLSKSEVKGPLLESFSKIDTNEDGFLSKAEVEKAPKPKRQGPPNGGQGGPPPRN